MRRDISRFAAAASCAVLRYRTFCTGSSSEFLSSRRNEYCCLEYN